MKRPKALECAPLNSNELADIKAAKRGDTAAFTRLVEAYQRPVYNLAYRMLGDSAEAEEAAQEAFLRRTPSFRPISQATSSARGCFPSHRIIALIYCGAGA